jgi:hypothetical protein
MAAAKNGAPAFGELNTVPGALQQTHTKGAFKLADRARKHPAQNVCFRKGIGQEVAWAKFQAMLQSMLADVLVEHRMDLGQIKANAFANESSTCDLDGQTSFCGPDVDESTNVTPSEYCRDRLGGQAAAAGHTGGELFQ